MKRFCVCSSQISKTTSRRSWLSWCLCCWPQISWWRSRLVDAKSPAGIWWSTSRCCGDFWVASVSVLLSNCTNKYTSYKILLILRNMSVTTEDISRRHGWQVRFETFCFVSLAHLKVLCDHGFKSFKIMFDFVFLFSAGLHKDLPRWRASSSKVHAAGQSPRLQTE